MSITLEQITKIINSSTDSELAQTLEDQGVFDQKLSTPCLQAIADKLTTMTPQNAMTLFRATGSGEEAIYNLPELHGLQTSAGSVKDIVVMFELLLYTSRVRNPRSRQNEDRRFSKVYQVQRLMKWIKKMKKMN
tara:strand:- start:635 stop:1036 length:402 start_codon:yes stop_codon:yes gene_type:complete